MSYIILFIIKFLDNVSRISYSHRVIRNIVDDNAACTDDVLFANVKPGQTMPPAVSNPH